MRVEKKVLNDALRILGKVVCQTSPVELYRSIRFIGDEDGAMAMATDGVEVVSVILPVNFGELVSQAATIVDRSNYRRLLQGINLSSAGVTATDGKQLLHLPRVLSLPKDVTIPFPSALLAVKTSEMGTLQVWDTFFQIEIGNFKWHGNLLEGQYPNWRGVIPSAESHDYIITLHAPEKVLNWVKMIPNQKTTNGVELNVMPDGSVTLVSCIQPNFELNTSATVTGVHPRAVLTLDREILLRMLLQG